MFKRLFSAPSKMNGITLAVVCMFTVSYSIEGTILPHSFRRDDNAVLREEVHDKIAYIAAITDQEHLMFIDGLKSSKPRDVSEAAIERLVIQHMINVTRTILPDIESLTSMSDNLEQSASEVNEHFAEDHVEAILQAVYGDENQHPKFYKVLAKRIATFAQTHIRLIFKHKNKNI